MIAPGVRFVHQLIDQSAVATGTGPRNVRIKVGCGLEGPPYGMGDRKNPPPGEIKSSAWSQDVTCPLCRLRQKKSRKDAVEALA